MTDLDQNLDASNIDTIPTLSLPKPTGEYAVGTTNYSFIDLEREEIYTEDPNDKREITAKVWYPSEAISEAEPAPYINEAYSNAIATAQGIPPEDFAQILESIETNSIADAPVAKAESEYPVLVFSHGFGDLPELNAIKAEELASQGYVVVGINHTYDSAVNVLADGRIIPPSPTFTEVEDESEISQLLGEAVNIRATDAQFVLDELETIDAGNDPTGLLSGKLDLDRTGIFGYSLGGATAVKVLAEDRRFQAGINLDGGLFGDTANASLTQPFLFQNNEAFGTGDSDANLNQFNQLQQSFVENLQNDGYEITIAGTEHNSFNDVSFLSSFFVNSGVELGDLTEVVAPNSDSENFEPIEPQLATEIINSYSTAFFDRYLNGEESPLLADDSSPYPEVTFQSYGADGNDTLTGSSVGEPIVGHDLSELTSPANDEIGRFDISFDGKILINFTPGEDITELSRTIEFDDLEIVRGQGDNAGDILINFDSQTIAVLDDIIATETLI